MIFNISKVSDCLKKQTEEILKQLGDAIRENGYLLESKESDRFCVSFDGKTFRIEYTDLHLYFRGLHILHRFGGRNFSVCEDCKVKELGIMLDCSRNAVKSVSFIKSFLRYMALMGYNQLYLYIEDTYTIEGEPYFGYMRGRYTVEELQEVDSYASLYGIEVIPCIQTLAHLNQIFRWKDYKQCHDIANILLIGEEKTYELIEKMLFTMTRCFKTRKIHLGMDEAFLVGRGKYEDLHGSYERKEILMQHLKKVLELSNKYKYQPIIWSDMFYRIAFDGFYGNEKTDNCMLNSKDIPDNLRLVYWDYNGRKHYNKVMKNHLQMGGETVFAGGVWGWLGFTPHNYFSIEESKIALQTCEKYKIDRIIFTFWGDCGAECSPMAMLPSFYSNAEYCYGHKEDNGENFKLLTGVDIETFMLLDSADRLDKNAIENVNNPSKYMLYNDVLAGIYDWLVKPEGSQIYKEHCTRLKKAKEQVKEYGYLFETQYCLCDVLSIKYDLGVRTRAAYKAKDKKVMEEIIKDYALLIRKINKFYLAFRNQWMIENKSFGFEVQDFRLGGLLNRIKHGKEWLQNWVNGKTANIIELESEILTPFEELANKEDYTACQVFFPEIVSANIL